VKYCDCRATIIVSVWFASNKSAGVTGGSVLLARAIIKKEIAHDEVSEGALFALISEPPGLGSREGLMVHPSTTSFASTGI
jgi:hypothetical protein